jgi:hypothetical protein
MRSLQETRIKKWVVILYLRRAVDLAFLHTDTQKHKKLYTASF